MYAHMYIYKLAILYADTWEAGVPVGGGLGSEHAEHSLEDVPQNPPTEGDLTTYPVMAWCMGGREGPRARTLFSLSLSPLSLASLPLPNSSPNVINTVPHSPEPIPVGGGLGGEHAEHGLEDVPQSGHLLSTCVYINLCVYAYIYIYIYIYIHIYIYDLKKNVYKYICTHIYISWPSYMYGHGRQGYQSEADWAANMPRTVSRMYHRVHPRSAYLTRAIIEYY